MSDERDAAVLARVVRAREALADGDEEYVSEILADLEADLLERDAEASRGEA